MNERQRNNSEILRQRTHQLKYLLWVAENRLKNGGFAASPHLIREWVAGVCGISVTEMMSKSKKQKLSDARVILVRQMYQYGYATHEIATTVNRHYTNISYYLMRHAELMLDANFRQLSTQADAVVRAYSINLSEQFQEELDAA